MHPSVFPHPPFPDHALLDSGGGEKLERFGEIVLRRPDPQALWRRRLPDEAWAEAHLTFSRDPASGGRRGHWIASPGAPARARGPSAEWTVRWRDTTCIVRPTPFKHVGVFPEQATNWAWTSALAEQLGDSPRLLNLFGYTGVASVVAARAGYAVTHVDASRASLAWARENLAASGLADDSLRIVLDDALGFARREARRGARYEGILVDPPHHGRGPKGERWQLEEDLAPLVEACGELLAPRSFLVLSAYAVGFSPLAFENLLSELAGGDVSTGELALPEGRAESAPARLLPCGFCARWVRGVEA